MKKYGDKIVDAIEKPDVVFDDHKNSMTAMFVKRVDDNGVNVIVKLAMTNDDNDRSFVTTMHSIGKNGLKRLEKKNKTIYSRG